MENTKEKSIQHKNRDIIRQVKEGEQKAQFQLYKYYFNTMFKTSLDIVKDEGKAEDAINEAFLKAFDKIDSYDCQDNFGNWLENIIIYQSKNKIEKNKKENKNIDIQKDKKNKQSLFNQFIKLVKSKEQGLRKLIRSFNLF